MHGKIVDGSITRHTEPLLDELRSVADYTADAAARARAPEAASLMLIGMRLDDIIESLSEPNVEPLPPLERVGALELWRRELRAGVGGQRINLSSTWRCDALWRAACFEAQALEAERDGSRTSAERLMERAATIIAESAETLAVERAA
jgi:hypothetical protein